MFSFSKNKLKIGIYFELIGNIPQALELQDEMEKAGIVADWRFYTSIITGMVKSGDMQGAYNLLNRMLDRKIEPNTVHYVALLARATKLEDIPVYKRVLKEMRNKGLNPRINAYEHLINIMDEVGDSEGIEEIEKEIALNFKQSVVDNVDFVKQKDPP